LDERFGELAPWPEVKEVLQQLSGAGVRLGIVTNCSERLGRIAAARTGVDWDVMVTAERAGFYKPDARTYRLAMQELGAGMEDCLFVAGSAYDLSVTKNVGLPVYWHDRIGMAVPDGMPAPLVRESSLRPLVPMVIADSL
jgi:2-haloalkanoic acid dehalogenase type II